MALPIPHHPDQMKLATTAIELGRRLIAGGRALAEAVGTGDQDVIDQANEQVEELFDETSRPCAVGTVAEYLAIVGGKVGQLVTTDGATVVARLYEADELLTAHRATAATLGVAPSLTEQQARAACAPIDLGRAGGH